MKKAWYWSIRNSVRFWFFVLTGGFRVVDAKNVPRTGPLILAPNHASFLDPPALACALPRMTTFMAKEELFRNKFFGWLISSVGSFPVRRGTTDTEAIRNAAKLLAEGSALLIFPEGTRNDGETMLPINRGVELLARKSGASVVPVGIVGTHIKWGKGRKRKLFQKVTVRFGSPIRPDEFGDSKTAFAEELAKRIAMLCNEEGYELRIAPDTKPNTTSIPNDGGSELPNPASASIQSPQ